uniref:uncharacterized protein LOC118152841 n=1 Tax=Callithrix jacchus TaxID=9483 RepID=UPI0023DD55DE|nr:uncharacterized protein LOC118152841 [Callithrix jacchus]
MGELRGAGQGMGSQAGAGREVQRRGQQRLLATGSPPTGGRLSLPATWRATSPSLGLSVLVCNMEDLSDVLRGLAGVQSWRARPSLNSTHRDLTQPPEKSGDGSIMLRNRRALPRSPA